ncbi:hypothetical protein [Zymomonas mobilis]|nr:hypothetical protein [Zymomonas mobilis]
MISDKKPILAQSLLNFLNSQPQNPSDRYRYKPLDNRYNDDNACTLDIGGEINHHVLNIKPILECKNNNLGAKIYGNYSSVSPPGVGGSLQLNKIPLTNLGQLTTSISHSPSNGTSGTIGIGLPLPF